MCSGIVVQGYIHVASLMLSPTDEVEMRTMDLQLLRSLRVYTGILDERCEHELDMHEKVLDGHANHF